MRGFDLGLSGALMSLIAITGLIVTGPGGTLIDRSAPARSCSPGCASMIAGCTLLAFATHPAVAAVALVLIGVNFGVSWPGFNALIATVVEGDLRQQYFGVNFALVNLGIGVGGIIGGFYVDVTHPETFTMIFLVDAATEPDPDGAAARSAAARPHPGPSRPTTRRATAAATARSCAGRRCCG